MLKYLFRGFRRPQPPASPSPRALPPPDVPVVALTPVPAEQRPKGDPISRADYALADERNDTVAADLEECFALIRARQHLSDAQRRVADGEFLVNMGVVEKFAYQELDFGPECTHHIPVKTLGQAFDKWVKASGRYEVSKASFARAMTRVLEWQGGHRSTIDGQDLFVGCRMTMRFAESIGFDSRVDASQEGKTRLGMGIGELSGGRMSPG